MEKKLEKSSNKIWHYSNGGRIWHYSNGGRVDGAHESLSGDATGLRGDVGDCDLSDEERKRGVSVHDLVKIKVKEV